MMHIRHFRTTVALGALGIATSAVAQTGPAPAAPAAEVMQAAPGDGIVDIFVTAQRRAENAQRAALAVDVIAPAVLQNAGVVTATTLNAAVPSLYVVRSGGANSSFFIRGVGNFTNNGYSDPAIAFNVDGVYYGRPTSTTGTFYDLDRIEVLKGPQGTLYGRNATGGAINIIPAKPRLGELSGYATGGYGRFDAVDLEGAINIPIGEQFAVRASGKYFSSDGYFSDGTSDEKGYAARLQLLGQLTDNFTVRVSGDYSHTGGLGTGYSFTGVLNATPGTAATTTSPANFTFVPSGLGPRSGLLSPEGRAYFANTTIIGPQIKPAPLNTPFQDNDYYGTNAEFTLNTDIGTLTVIPAYRHSKVDNLFNGPAFRGGLITETDKQFSVETRFDGKRVGPIDWLVGGFYYDETIHGQYTFSQYTVNSFQEFDTGTKSYAAFGRLTGHVSDAFRLVGALRYTSDKKDFNGGGPVLVDICTRPPVPFGPGCFGGPSVPVASSYAALAALIPASQIPFGLPTAPGPANAKPFGSSGNLLFYSPVQINATQKKNRVTYRLAAEYDVAPSSLLYVSYETGFRSGGFNVSAGRESYSPEYITALTFGSKNRFLDNRLQVNVEVFRWQYRDQQVGHFGLDVNGASSLFSENIGKSRIQGVDLDLVGKLAANTVLRGSVQYLDNKLQNFAYKVAASANPVVGCPFTPSTDQFGRASYRVDCSGKPGFNSPKWASNIGIDQSFEVGGDYVLMLTADGRYRSNRIIGFEYLPQQNSGSDFTIDASLTLSAPGNRWSVTGYVRNLTNETVPVLAQYAGSTGNTITTSYTAPRTYGGRVRFNL